MQLQQRHLRASTQRQVHAPSARRRPTVAARRDVAARVADLQHGGSFASGAEGEDGGAAGAGCPFLQARGLRTPPLINIPWLKRVHMEVLDVAGFQPHVLGQAPDGEDMVRLPKQPGFAGIFMPATAQLVKDVFAEEASGRVTQGLAEEDYRAFPLLLGPDNLLVVKDPARHQRLRALLQPAFAADAVASYLPDIQALVGRHLAAWEAAGQAGIKAYPNLKTLTFDFIMQVVMGRAVPDAELARLSDLFGVLGVGLVAAWPYMDLPFTPFHRALKAKRELWAFFEGGVAAARQQLAAGEPVPGVLGRLVAAQDEEGNRLTDAEVISNILLILFAGHDTSSTTLTRCLSNLQDHPAAMDRLRAEQAAVLAKHGEPITAAALKDMPYADAVIRETLRRDPTVSLVMRVAAKDMALGQYAVPAGTVLYLPTRNLAANEPRWTDKSGDMHPSVFNPERMMTPEGSKPGQLMPFGAGVRYCLGAGLAMAEMKLFLALLARHYAFAADNDTQWRPALGYYPVNGLPLVMTRA